ncbi:MAG TPA: hypothetical protein VM308_01180 [Sphingomicrobium sp.]|nr:hypothetical protein [Sphingomicrobium sp.]
MSSAHPHFVPIPDPQQVEGVRAYREPAEPHPLQLLFLDADRERIWIEELRALVSAGRTGDADALLSGALAGFDGALARLARSTTPDSVTLEGWEDLLPILAEWEGPPITAITLGLTNPPDLVFEPGATFEPELLIGLYSDETFAFSDAATAELIAECAEDMPAWAGGEEDVEFYCTLSGLADLNTALVHCKHRHFLRDGRDGVEGRAPGGYVEFVLGSWLLAVRFLQAAERAFEAYGLPDQCRLITGAVGTSADFVTVFGAEPARSVEARAGRSPEPAFAPLTIKPWVPREDPTVDAAAAGAVLRRRLQPAEGIVQEQPRPGLLSRLFGRLRRR